MLQNAVHFAAHTRTAEVRFSSASAISQLCCEMLRFALQRETGTRTAVRVH